MTARRDTDRLIATWLTEVAPERHVDYLDTTLEAIGAIGQRPAWASPTRWLPSQLTGHRVALPRLAPILVILALLLAATLVGLAIAGSRPRLPAPFGLAATGLVAFESGGDIVATLPDGTSRRTLIDDAGFQWGQVWSHRGDRFAYWSAPTIGDPASLWVADPDGRNRQLLTAERTLFTAGSRGVPARGVEPADYLPGVNWSPDDRSLAFATDSTDGTAGLYVVNADGTDLRRIGDDTHQRADPVWSPNGALIAYRGQPLNDPYTEMSSWVITPDGRTDLLVIPAVGPEEFSNANPSWSRDGQSFLVQTGQLDGIDISIAERDAEGTWSHRVIVGGPNNDYHPAWSTSGTQFSFIRLVRGSDPETFVLMVADADGSHVRPVTSINVTYSVQCWSPDDRFIRVAGPVAAGAERTILLTPLDGSPVLEIPAPGDFGNGVCQVQRIAP